MLWIRACQDGSPNFRLKISGTHYMLWWCEFSPLGHGIFWWNTGNPQQGYIILSCALSLVYRVTEVHHSLKTTRINILTAEEKKDKQQRIQESLPLIVNTALHSLFTQRRTENETMGEAQAEEVREVAHFSPHSLSGRAVRCWTLPSGWFWLVVAVCWLSGCCPAPTLILSGPLVVPFHGLLEVCQLTDCQTTQHH